MWLLFLAPSVLAILTFRAVDNDIELVRRNWYYVLVGALLASSATTTIGAGMTVFVSPGQSVLGLLGLGTTNLVVAILAWRALVQPAPRRAALAGMVAAGLEIVAVVVDVIRNFNVDDSHYNIGFEIALVGGLVTLGTGALACIAALATFRRPTVIVPEARVVDKD